MAPLNKRRGEKPVSWHGELGRNETGIIGDGSDARPYVEGCSLLSVQGLGDEHVAADGVDVVDSARRLIGARSGDAVADADILVLI